MVEYEATYDVIVVGAGHAGCEAALAPARMGSKTLLLNLYLDNVALMACNPAVGGSAKSHIVKEVDALGGEIARNTDRVTLNARILNLSKGPAIWALRAQVDMKEYQIEMKKVLENQPNLELKQALVEEILVKDGKVYGVGTREGLVYRGKAVIVSTGTYLGGKVFIGLVSFPSGPLGQQPSLKLTESLRKLGIKIGRLKTGTCPRVHSDTIDYSNLTIQESADTPLAFSIYSEKRVYSGYPCWLTRSTNKTHDIIRVNLDRSPLFTGVIEGVGPRYCPSIEDRVTKFPDRDSHPIFLEPTGRRTKEIYLQNFTTSLPLDAQVKMVRSIPGLENAEIMRPGYAIEYDFAPPTQLKPSLESKIIRGLFLAGQINGTSGYEEAAGQGIIAGINAVQYIKGEPPFIPDRSEAYIGVMIDDLVTKGVKEPYRMMTSRAEYRLLIRQDNADLRMVPYGYKFGMVPRYIYERILRKKKRIAEEIERLKHTKIPPTDKVNEILRSKESSPIDETTTIYRLLKRPEINYKDIMMFDPNLSSYEEDVYEEVEIEIKYEGYIQKQNKLVEQFRKLEDKLIPEWIDYDKVPGLLTEAREKLKTIRPRSLGQASRIEGVNPADISVLMVYLSASKRKTA